MTQIMHTATPKDPVSSFWKPPLGLLDEKGLSCKDNKLYCRNKPTIRFIADGKTTKSRMYSCPRTTLNNINLGYEAARALPVAG